MAESDSVKPLCIDLFCGLGGWTEGFLAEGYDCFGFDIERHDYGTGRYPGDLVLQDILTLHGSQFKDAAIIVASPPCQEFSCTGLPFKQFRGLIPKADLFDACFRIQREAEDAAGRTIPMIVENVRSAQKWVGRARWHADSFYLWGDVPALMPKIVFKKNGGTGSWFGPYNQRKDRWAGNQSLCGSSSIARKEASARIAMIPPPLSRYLAQTYKPQASD